MWIDTARRARIALVLVPFLLGGVVGPVAPVHAAGSSPSESSTPPAPTGQELSPEQRAAMARQEAESLYEKGWGEVEEAREEIRTAAAAEAKDPKAAAAARQSALKRVRKALDRFRKATELAPDYAEAWNMLGFSYRKTGQIGNALKAYRTALRLRPDYAEAHEYLAEAHLLTGNVERAKMELVWLEKNQPDLARKLAAAIARKEAGADSLALHAADW